MAFYLKSYFICLLVFVSCIKPGSTSEIVKIAFEMKKLAEVANKCRATVGATGDDLKDLIRDQELKTKTSKCLLACTAIDLKLVDKNGAIVKTDFMAYAKEYSDSKEFLDTVSKIFDTCFSKKKYVITITQCDDAVEFKNCMTKEGDLVIKNIKL